MKFDDTLGPDLGKIEIGKIMNFGNPLGKKKVTSFIYQTFYLMGPFQVEFDTEDPCLVKKIFYGPCLRYKAVRNV